MSGIVRVQDDAPQRVGGLEESQRRGLVDTLTGDAHVRASVRLGEPRVVLVVHPEHIDHRPRHGRGLEFHASVEVMESMGNAEHVDLSSGGHELVAIVDARTPLTIGDSLTSSAPTEAIHLFHPESGVVLK